MWTGRVESRRSTDRSHSADCGAAIVVTAAASTPVDHWSGREGFKEQLQGNEKDSPLFIGRQRWPHRERCVVSSCEVCAKPIRTRFKRKFTRKRRQLWLMVAVFVSLLVEASHHVHTAATRRLTAMPFSTYATAELCRGYKILRPRLNKYCRMRVPGVPGGVDAYASLSRCSAAVLFLTPAM